jgi:hypothetical protein
MIIEQPTFTPLLWRKGSTKFRFSEENTNIFALFKKGQNSIGGKKRL